MKIRPSRRALRKRLPQFSLRDILLAFIVISLLIGYPADRARKQRQVRSDIHRMGGCARYKSLAMYDQVNWPFPYPGQTICLELWEPDGLRRWLPSWIGLEWVDSIAAVRLVNKDLSREMFASVARLPYLEYLSLYGSEFQVDDLQLLAGCRSLKYLHLAGTRIGDAQMCFVSDIQSLEELTLSDTSITARGLKWLIHLPNLKRLWLDDTQVTNASLVTLATCTNLEQLSLCRTNVDDNGLQHLRELRSLRVLNVQRTSVTASGVEELRDALPNCEVFWEEDSSL